MSNPTPRQRKAIYRAVSAVLVLLVLYKVVTAEQAVAYLQALGILLGVLPAELAARNVPVEPKQKRRRADQ